MVDGKQFGFLVVTPDSVVITDRRVNWYTLTLAIIAIGMVPD